MYTDKIKNIMKNTNTRNKITIAINKLKKLTDNKKEVAILELKLKRKNITINDMYPTTPEIFQEIFNTFPIPRKNINAGNITVVDPCAGLGNMLDLLNEYWLNAKTEAIEINQEFLSILKQKGYKTKISDIFSITRLDCDYVFMNPPFSLEKEFIKHIYNITKDNTKIISICSANITKDKKFKKWLIEKTDLIPEFCKNNTLPGVFELNNAPFKNSCTNVKTGIIYIIK